MQNENIILLEINMMLYRTEHRYDNGNRHKIYRKTIKKQFSKHLIQEQLFFHKIV